jgi:hypothetical protein
MRLLIASMAALAAVAFAAPSFAQDETMPAPTPAPTAKPKAASAASCQKLKNASQRNACLKKVKVAKASTTKKTKTRKPTAAPAPKQPDAAQFTPTPAPSSAPGTVAVPPLPQKTI